MSNSSIKEAYRNFLTTPHGVEVYRSFKRILYGADDSLVQVLNTQIFESLPVARRTPLCVCDIGGGDGERISRIARFLRDKFHNEIQLNFVEQSSLYTENFSKQKPIFFSSRLIHQGLFEEISLPENKFDLVLLIHSIFAFENGHTMDKLLSLRNPTGCIVVVSNAADSFLGELKKLADINFHDERYEIDDLERSLKKGDIPFKKHRFYTELAIEASNWIRDVGIMLDWITLGKFDSFEAHEKSRIFDYIESKSSPYEDRRFFREEESILLIPNIIKSGSWREALTCSPIPSEISPASKTKEAARSR